MEKLSSSSCRICYGGENQGQLQKYCKCTGSIGMCHQECLSKWVQERNRSTCELCHYRLVIKTKMKSFWKWRFPRLDPETATRFVFALSCYLATMLMFIIHCVLVFYTGNNTIEVTSDSVFGIYFEHLLLLFISFLMLMVDTLSFLRPFFQDFLRINTKTVILPINEPQGTVYLTKDRL